MANCHWQSYALENLRNYISDDQEIFRFLQFKFASKSCGYSNGKFPVKPEPSIIFMN